MYIFSIFILYSFHIHFILNLFWFIFILYSFLFYFHNSGSGGGQSMTIILVLKNSREKQLYFFSRSTLRNHFLFLVIISKHEYDRPESRDWKKYHCLAFNKFDFHLNCSREKEIISVFWKHFGKKCLNLDSHSLRLKERNSHFNLK